MVRVEEMLSRGDTSTCSQILRHEPLVVGRVFKDFPPRSAHTVGTGRQFFHVVWTASKVQFREGGSYFLIL